MPRVRQAYNNEHFDIEIMKEMGEQGFLGCTISDYDLPGLSSTAYGKLVDFNVNMIFATSRIDKS